MKEILKSFSKNYKYIVIAVVLIVIGLFIISVFFYFREISKPPTEKVLTLEEIQKQIIDSLTAPGEEGKDSVSKETIEGLSTQKETKSTPAPEVPEDILKNLTAPK